MLALAAVVIGAIVYAFMPRPVAVDVAEVTRGPLRVVVEEEGQTRVRDRYVVSSPIGGRLRRVRVEEGEPTVAGQTLLAAVDPAEATIPDPRALAEAEARVRVAQAALERAKPEVERARAEYEFAETESRRITEAFERAAVSPHEMDEAQTRKRTAEASLRSAEFAEEVARFELRLAETALLRARPRSESDPEPGAFEIRAPVDGRVLRVLQESATVVAPGTPLVEVGDPADLEIVIDVLSTDAVRIRPGAVVTLHRWGGGRPLDARVRLVEPAAFTKVSALGVEEQRVNVIADFTGPREERDGLGDAYRVEAAIEVWARDDVLRVPTSAMLRRGDRWAVFVESGGRASLRLVEVGERSAESAQVLGGLAAGERVIVYPGDQVRDGARVRVRR